MKKFRVIHLEDDPSDAFFVQKALEHENPDTEIVRVASPLDYLTAVANRSPDLILIDSGAPGLSGTHAVELAREKHPHIPVIVVSGATNEKLVSSAFEAGATDYVVKHQLWQLSAAIRRARRSAEREQAGLELEQQALAKTRLVAVVQELSLARDLDTIMAVVRKAARELTGADGATFVLREGEFCHYADENAIAPLWKGQRFPLTSCISGWAMLNRQPAVIEDIYVDPRIPADAYRPTFVQSLVMVPIRTQSPIGAIGNYWARRHAATKSEVELLQALANTTAVAMENVQLYNELEQRVNDRTQQLQAANQDLEAFSYSVSHDLRAPLRRIGGFAELLRQELPPGTSENSERFLGKIDFEITRMGGLIDDLLRLARFARVEMNWMKVNLNVLAADVVARLRASHPSHQVEFSMPTNLEAWGDPGLLQVVIENLLSNAWKYTLKRERAIVEFGSTSQPDGSMAFFIRDNGAGFSMEYADKLFTPFQRLHSEKEFAGNGIGLATVQRIIRRHGGQVWASAEVEQGATFSFTLPTPQSRIENQGGCSPHMISSRRIEE